MKRPRIDDTEDKITGAALADNACALIEAGAVLTVVRSGILQHTIPVAINDVPVAVNQDMKALITDERVLNRFLAYQIQGCQSELREEWVKQGATVESIEHQCMAESRFAVSPKDEQQAIADYLDAETSRIDALICHAAAEIALLKAPICTCRRCSKAFWDRGSGWLRQWARPGADDYRSEGCCRARQWPSWRAATQDATAGSGLTLAGRSMTAPIAPIHTEVVFEDEVCAHLKAHGWLYDGPLPYRLR